LRQAGLAGLLAVLMVLPAEQLLAAFCPMDAQERQQQSADCCPYTSRDAASTGHADTGNPHSGGPAEDPGAGSDCNSCTDCVCAFVPYKGNTGPSVRDANVPQTMTEIPAASRSILYILSETIDRPDPPRKPLPAPVPAFLANRVLLN
jgi:hypothetical protein